MSDDKFATYQAATQRQYEEDIRRQMEANRLARENQERIIFEHLMRKHGKPA